MGIFFTPHARKRAAERYGLDLSIPELSAILTACVKGGAILVQDTGNAPTYTMEMRGVRIFPRLSPDKLRIITFMPKDFLKAGTRLDHMKRTGRAKQKPKCGVSTRGAYRRKRIRLADCDPDTS